MNRFIKLMDEEIIRLTTMLSKDPSSSLDDNELQDRIRELQDIESYLSVSRELISTYRRHALSILLPRRYPTTDGRN